MSDGPLRILVAREFEPELSRALAAEAFATPPLVRTITLESDSEIAVLLAETDVLVSGTFKSEWQEDRARSTLRLVHCVGAGIDSIDLKSLPPGCALCNVYGHGRGVAEHAVMLMLALQRNLFKLDAALRQGDWTPSPMCIPELRNRNLLILGLGHIGVELVRWGLFLDMKVSVLTRSPSKRRDGVPPQCTVESLDDLHRHLPHADFVVVAIPNTSGTEGLIDEVALRSMRRSAFIINVGRARVVEEAALYDALSTKRIAGAGLDVWYEYPDAKGGRRLPSRFPFQNLDNVIMTPHKPTIETMEYRWAKIANNIARFARSEPVDNTICTT